jgi:hypothetical protein
VPEPFVPLTDEDEEMVRRALHGKNRFAFYLLLLCDSHTNAYITSGI